MVFVTWNKTSCNLVNFGSFFIVHSLGMGLFLFILGPLHCRTKEVEVTTLGKGRKWSVIKDKVDIYCFYNWYDTTQEHLLFKLLLVSLKHIKKFLHFSFRTVGNFSKSKPWSPGQSKLNETLWAVRTCESPGVSRGMVRLGNDWYIKFEPYFIKQAGI